MTQRELTVPAAQVPNSSADQVKQKEERSRLTREALADVDCGRVIDHQAVQAWAESLDTGDELTAPVSP